MLERWIAFAVVIAVLLAVAGWVNEDDAAAPEEAGPAADAREEAPRGLDEEEDEDDKKDDEPRKRERGKGKRDRPRGLLT